MNVKKFTHISYAFTFKRTYATSDFFQQFIRKRDGIACKRPLELAKMNGNVNRKS